MQLSFHPTMPHIDLFVHMWMPYKKHTLASECVDSQLLSPYSQSLGRGLPLPYTSLWPWCGGLFARWNGLSPYVGSMLAYVGFMLALYWLKLALCWLKSVLCWLMMAQVGFILAPRPSRSLHGAPSWPQDDQNGLPMPPKT